MKFLTNNPNQTKKLGQGLAKEILGKRRAENKFFKKESFLKEQAFVIGLIGELGGGKTTFLQGFAKGLGVKEKILSPTFILMRKFEIRNPKFETPKENKFPAGKANFKFQIPKFQTFYHIDCYRIEKPGEVLNLGFKEIISNSQNIVAIEWADRIKKIMPQRTFWIKFEFVDKMLRKIIIKISQKGAKLLNEKL